MSKRIVSMIAIVAMMLFVVACGNNGGNNAAKTNNKGSNNNASTNNASTNGGALEQGPIELTDVKGTFTLDKPAQRVVVLEWNLTENVVALGMQPVGNADNENYKKWVSSEAALNADVADVGFRHEPNIESIAALEPDLIIGDIDSHEKIYDQLKGIAPTLLFQGFPPEGGPSQYEAMENIFKTIAKAVGKTAEGDKVLADLDKHYEDAKAKLAAAGKEGLNYVLTQAFSYQNVASMRLFKDNALAIQTLERIGLKNDWTTDAFELYGFSTNTVEALPAIQDTNFIHIVQSDDNIFETTLKDNSIWKDLTFVKENRVYAIDGATWVFGGPISSKVIVDQVVAALTK